MNNKSNTIKRIICVSLFLVLLIAAICGTYRALSWKETHGDYISSIEQLKNTPNNTIDVVFMGSSHVYCGIYPSLIWEKFGIASFNMAVSGQDKDSTYYTLKHLLKTQSPKVVCVDLFSLAFDKQAVEGNVYRNMLALPPSVDSIRLANDYFEGNPDAKLNDYYFRWPIIHTRYRELGKYDFVDYIPNSFLRGEYISFESLDSYIPTVKGTPFSPGELSPKNQKWLERLYDLSQKEGFSLAFLVIPSATAESHQPLFDAAAQFAETHNIDFIDFNRRYNDLHLDYNTDFFDSNHLNAYGAAKLSDYLAEYLQNNFSLSDYRGNPKYSQWDSDLDYFYRREQIDAISKSATLSEFCDYFLRCEDDYTLVVSLEYTYNLDNASENYYDSLKKLGMDSTEYSTGGKWLYSNRTLTKIHENDSSPTYVYELNNLDTLAVNYSGDGDPVNVMINTDSYSNAGCFISIILYDNKIQEVVASKKY